MIANEYKTLKIHHFINCIFCTWCCNAAYRGGFLSAHARLVGAVRSGIELVAALPLCATVPKTYAGLSSRSNDRRGSTRGIRFYLGIIRMSLDILLERGIVDQRSLTILLSSPNGQARLQGWTERAAQEEIEAEEQSISVTRVTESRISGYENHDLEADFSRFAVIKWLLILIVIVVIFKSF